jgi:hypothetical protein
MLKLEWLEKFAEDGLISEEAKQKIYADCGGLVKEAVTPIGQEHIEMLAEVVKSMRRDVAIGLTFAGASAGLKKTMDWIHTGKAKEAILNNREAVAAAHGKDSDKAKQRFDEVVSYAPHVAMNKALVSKIVAAKLNSGFTDEDAQRMALIQAQHTQGFKSDDKFKPTTRLGHEATGKLAADMYSLAKESAARAPMPIGTVGKYLSRMLLYTAAPLLIGVGSGVTNEIAARFGKKDMEEKLDEAFKKVMELSSPDKEPLHQDKTKARELFNALAHFAPNVALEPHAAKTFVLQSMAADQMPMANVKELSEIHRNLSSTAKPSAFMEAFQGAGVYTGSPKVFSEATNNTTDDFLRGTTQ